LFAQCPDDLSGTGKVVGHEYDVGRVIRRQCRKKAGNLVTAQRIHAAGAKKVYVPLAAYFILAR
jgi:hypothetical protein